MELDCYIPDIVVDEMLRVLKEVIVVLEKGYLSPPSGAGVDQLATQGAKLALSLIRDSLKNEVAPQRCAQVQPSGSHDICKYDFPHLVYKSLHPPLLAPASQETQSTLVEASESKTVHRKKSLQMTKEIEVAIPSVVTTLSSTDSSRGEEEMTDSWLDSLLDVIDPGGSLLFISLFGHGF